MSFLRKFLGLLLILPAVLPGEGRAAAPGAQPAPEPAIVAGVDGLTIEWWAPEVQALALPQGTTRLVVPDLPHVDQPGAPRLPYASVLVSLPPGAAPTLELRQVSETEQPLPGPVELAERPAGVLLGPDGQVVGGAFEPASPAVQFNPQVLVLEPLGIVRGAQLARLVFYPARPDGDRLRVATHINAVLHYNRSQGLPVPVQALKDPIAAMLRSAVANPQQIQVSQPKTGRDRSRPETAEAASPTAAVEVTQAGLTALAYESLAAAGFPLEGADAQHLRLSRAGIDIPTEWQDNGNASFGPGDSLLFYAAPRFSRWTAADVYFLQRSEAARPAMDSRTANPASRPAASPWVEVTAEKNIIYTPECYCGPIPAGKDGDRWAWKDLRLPDSASAAFPIELPAVDAGQAGSLSLWLTGYTDIEADPDHRVDVKLNDVPLGSVEWNGKEAIQKTLPIPASTLLEGANSLNLSLPGIPGVSFEGAWLDAFSIRYRRSSAAAGESLLFEGEATPHAYTASLASSPLFAYEVTDPDHPLKLNGTAISGTSITLGDPNGGGRRKYWVASQAGILSPSQVRLVSPPLTGDANGADYLMITPAEFQPALGDLAALRESKGLKVAIEQVQAIYDAYGDGRPDPAAIRAFLAHTYGDWNPRPTYVVLVGDGTADPRRYNPASSVTYVPPFLAEVDPWAGETAADNRYVTLEGEDNLPDMLIGRLPVNSLAETQAVVNKIVQYEGNPPGGSWNRKVLFLADNPDGAGDFPNSSEVVASTIAPPESVLRLYYTPSDAAVTPDPAAEALRQSLLANWNQGAGLIMFTGHASIHQWAVERFIHLDDVAGLNNGGRLPVLLEMTCFTASFQVPGYPTLDEALLRSPTGGAAAVWGPTGLGITTGHESLALGFTSTLLQGDGNRLGEAALAGKLRLAAERPAFLDLIDTYTLLGDPATQYNRVSRSDTIFFPQVLQK